MGPVFNHANITADFCGLLSANRRWAGTGDVGDPLIDQFKRAEFDAHR
jgi:hypothetical protein